MKLKHRPSYGVLKLPRDFARRAREEWQMVEMPRARLRFLADVIPLPTLDRPTPPRPARVLAA